MTYGPDVNVTVTGNYSGVYAGHLRESFSSISPSNEAYNYCSNFQEEVRKEVSKWTCSSVLISFVFLNFLAKFANS